MTGAALITLLLLALALALQPWSILAGILLATAARGTLKLASYISGWVLALTAVAVLTIVFRPDQSSSSGTSPVLHVVEIAAGSLVGIWLLARWRRPPEPEQNKQPAWMAKLDTMSPVFAFALGGFLPNYVFIVAAVSELLQLQVSTAALTAFCVAFVLVASTGVAAPLAVRVVRGDRAEEIYAGWRVWLITHNRAVMFTVGAVLAVALIGKGLVGLL